MYGNVAIGSFFLPLRSGYCPRKSIINPLTMYYVSKRIEISGSHQLSLSYDSKCRGLHGHNWVITVYCRSEHLNADGMVIDYHHIKELVSNRLDHRHLNDVIDLNPTAENLARWITEQVPCCYKTVVQESEGNMAMYVVDSNPAEAL